MTSSTSSLCGITFFLLLTVSGAVNAASVNLERCRRADIEFNYDDALSSCAVAAAETMHTLEERIEILRLLGCAHAALGDPDAARTWFLRLLVLDPTHSLDATLSPVYQEAFQAARAALDEEGRIVGAPVAENDVTALRVVWRVEDPLGRIASAEALVADTAGQEFSLPATVSRMTSAPAEIATTLPASVGPGAVTVSLRLRAASGAPLVATLGDPVRVEVKGKDVTPTEGDGPPWLLIGGGSLGVALVVAVVGTGGGIAATCFLSPLCRGPPPESAYVRVGPSESAP